MSKKYSLTQENLIKKFSNSDVSDVYDLPNRSDQIIWVLQKIKKDFGIEDFIADSVLVEILVQALGISCNIKSVNNSLNPIKAKIHKKIVEGELYYKVMHEGIKHIEKLLRKSHKTSDKKPVNTKSFDNAQSLKDTINKVKQMGRGQHLRPGLYYVVLIDLVGSSIASSKINPEENKKRIKQFIGFTKQALPLSSKNYLTFVKDIGDASLFLFSNFQDILQWATKTDLLCNEYNQKCIEKQKSEIYQMHSKKCIHLGEVFFDNDSDPIALSINQISKIEKEFSKDQLGITDAVKQVILPRINSNQLRAKKLKKIILPGENVARPLWVIGYDS